MSKVGRGRRSKERRIDAKDIRSSLVYLHRMQDQLKVAKQDLREMVSETDETLEHFGTETQ